MLCMGWLHLAPAGIPIYNQEPTGPLQVGHFQLVKYSHSPGFFLHSKECQRNLSQHKALQIYCDRMVGGGAGK